MDNMSKHVQLSESERARYIYDIQLLKAGFDHVNDHVVITDPRGNILYANEAVTKNTGYLLDEILGHNPGDLWGGHMPKEFYQEMWHVVAEEKKPFVGEVKNVRKDGTEYWQEIHISPVFDEHGAVRFFIGIEPNITGRKDREKFREEFNSILSHQLRNPLTAINWSLQWLFEQGGLSIYQKETLEGLYKENQTLLQLVADLLSLSRMERIDNRTEDFDLAELVRSILEMQKPHYKDKEFSCTATGAYPMHNNRSLALQVCTNIIANAADYSAKEKGRVTMSLAKKPGEYVFSCENNGAAIPLEEQSKIFTRFFRTSNARAYKEQGTGLGLYIVKMITDHLGWHVSFTSPAAGGEGTIFYVRIPAGR
ncbi:MAG: hypothetical protein A2756_02225 [Candidatus Ryanbacteria bacterium RIFCSPHIGHO2_01_FULL_48_27]|uniref:histidine kinase n=1 Tax=Candidatus Ryanbacteria bacterium RIFCSPHIGHO2_01_FULL_48_27 TaxID=1802115 RepID=A0A1G2G6K0_9BACT|nr:MAG: hypothetical protein A2756_02225 [Candidatus Ryanbacteria bacterium RIFCSPHIGHO2_01_FULL_48_27]